jgi:hypothetical protein
MRTPVLDKVSISDYSDLNRTYFYQSPPPVGVSTSHKPIGFHELYFLSFHYFTSHNHILVSLTFRLSCYGMSSRSTQISAPTSPDSLHAKQEVGLTKSAKREGKSEGGVGGGEFNGG